ncbi:MAG: chorismate mutase [Acidobacteria bacterium]|nr:chorismate mutase [Acidobacteriota bacterium]
MDIADWRKKIDEIDRRLVELLNERARCVAEIGQIKRQNGLPVQEPNREREVLRQVLEANQGPLDDAALRRVFEQIVEEGRSLQRRFSEADSPFGIPKKQD